MNNINEILNTYLKHENGDLNIFGKIIVIAIMFVATNFIVNLSDKLIDKTLSRSKNTNYFTSNKRANTIAQILKKVVKYILYFIVALMVLEMFGVRTTSILATAGVGGLAIGFGAQSLVKDVITGFFILLENQFAVGDYIQVSSFEGVVEELGMRVTKLRDFSGELHIIPNGEIKVVTNRTRGAMRALVHVEIAYEEDIDRAMSVIEKVSQEIKDTNESIVEGPTILGVVSLDASGVVIRVAAKTLAMEQWSVERQMLKKIKEAFDRENIEIPYNKMVVYKGDGENDL